MPQDIWSKGQKIKGGVGRTAPPPSPPLLKGLMMYMALLTEQLELAGPEPARQQGLPRTPSNTQQGNLISWFNFFLFDAFFLLFIYLICRHTGSTDHTYPPSKWRFSLKSLQ